MKFNESYNQKLEIIKLKLSQILFPLLILITTNSAKADTITQYKIGNSFYSLPTSLPYYYDPGNAVSLYANYVGDVLHFDGKTGNYRSLVVVSIFKSDYSVKNTSKFPTNCPARKYSFGLLRNSCWLDSFISDSSPFVLISCGQYRSEPDKSKRKCSLKYDLFDNQIDIAFPEEQLPRWKYLLNNTILFVEHGRIVL